MPGLKKIADLITLARAMLGFGLAWLGLAQGAAGLTWAIPMLIAAWTGDVADGRIARRSPVERRSWIGDHDLHIDMGVSCGVMVYLLGAGFLTLGLAAGYLVFWAAVFLRFGLEKSLGMLFQAPLYGWFIWIALTQAPASGYWLLAWILAVVAVTWPEFPRQLVPAFLAGMRRIWTNRRERK
jgi:hypothetical protein